MLYLLTHQRNAWNNTWISRYSNFTLFTRRWAAEDFAEKQRTRGTKFGISELPSLVLKSGNMCAVISQVNAEKPLSYKTILDLQEKLRVYSIKRNSKLTFDDIISSFSIERVDFMPQFPEDAFINIAPIKKEFPFACEKDIFVDYISFVDDFNLLSFRKERMKSGLDEHLRQVVSLITNISTLAQNQ